MKHIIENWEILSREEEESVNVQQRKYFETLTSTETLGCYIPLNLR
jgi:hypothetical protein